MATEVPEQQHSDEPDFNWPTWPYPDAELAHVDGHADGYGSLGRYVFAGNLVDHPMTFRSDTRMRLAQTHPEGADLDRAIALSLFEDLRDVRLRYAPVSWVREGLQHIRSPHDVLAFTGNGTCIDLAVLLATAYTAFDLSAFIVVLREGEGGGHALVAVRTRSGGYRTDEGLIDWDLAGQVGYVNELDTLADHEDWLLIDPTHACVGMTAQGPAPDPTRLDPVWAHLVTVPAAAPPYLPAPRHEVLTKPLPEPEPLARVVDLPRADGVVEVEGAARTHRGQVIDDLSGATGVVALYGGQGVGKSRLALEVARAWGNGRGWRLLGADLKARDLSLSRNEAFEQDVPESLDPNDVIPFAAAALVRLKASGRWVVVLDNLVLPENGSIPKWVKELEPMQGAPHLLIVTTNEPAERLPERWQLVPVLFAPASDLDPDIAGVSAGSVLLQSAFRRLLDHQPGAYDPSWALTAAPDVHVGASALWAAADGVLSADQAREARRLSLMPPDNLGKVAPDISDAVWSHGLIGREDGAVNMHRLVGEAIRSSLSGDAEAVAEEVLRDRDRALTLLVGGDRSTTDRLAEALVECRDGLTLANLANIQEVHDNNSFRATFDKAGKLLNPADPSHAVAYADYLHDQARRINQNGGTVEQKEDAVAWALEAEQIRVRAGVPGELKHRAMRALLLRGIASALPKDSPERRRGLEEALDVLNAGYEARRDDPLESSISVDRAFFNLAGTYIGLAQTTGIDPVSTFEAALDVYERTRAFRYETYGKYSNFTGASVYGEGMSHYYLALHTSGAERLQHANDAVELVNTSIDIRAAFNKGEQRKSAELLIKGALLQLAIAHEVDHATEASPLIKKVNEYVGEGLGELVDVWRPDSD